MNLKKTSYFEALSLYKDYYNQFHVGIDGYYEKKILGGEHYILVDKVSVGIVSINETQLTGFYIFNKKCTKYKGYFTFVLNQGIVKRIMFSTIDTRLFKEIQDRNFKIEYQAYNFVFDSKVTTDFKMKVASINQLGFIKDNFKAFIEESVGNTIKEFTKKIDDSEVFIGYDSYGIPVSMGVLEKMILNPNKYCLGMIVLENYRLKGYGVKTLKYLIRFLEDDNKEVNARCWYYNEGSKRTLLKTGFQISNLLLRIEGI